MSNPLTQVQVRRATSAAFTAANPTLAAGEIGWESNTRKLKIGDGVTVWAPLPYYLTPAPQTKLFQFAIPVGKSSNGSIGNNGALSGITALPTTYANIYLYFPANAIAAGVAAGYYYCQMSSATAGTIFNNLLAASGVPTIPGSPTAFVTTGPGAFTQITTSDIAITLAVAGNTLGLSGQISVYANYAQSNSAASKTLTVQYGGTNVIGLGASAQDSLSVWHVISGRAVSNAQVTGAIAASTTGGGANAPAYLAIDETASQNVTIALQINATPASNWIVLEAFQLTLS